MNTSANRRGLNPTPTNKRMNNMKNNCQGCGCINKDQCICMKEQCKDKFITRHPAGVDITFNSWEEYNKYMVYENKIREEQVDRKYIVLHKSGVTIPVTITFDNQETYNKFEKRDFRG